MNNEKDRPIIRTDSQFKNIELKTVLRKLLRERGITISSLSKSTHVPLQTLHGWLHGSEPKNLKQVKKVADHLEVNLDYFCFGVESKKICIQDYEDEINAGTFEVILRKVKRQL